MASDSTPKPSCEQIIDMLPEPFVVIDREYRIVAANRQYARRYGVAAEEVVGRRCHEVSHHSPVPCSQQGEHCPLEEVFRTRQPAQVMHVHYDCQGREEHVQLSANPIYGQDGEILYMGEYIQAVTPLSDDTTPLVGRSPALMRMVSLLQRVAPTQTTVLLLGESGAGKERVAKYLHHYSKRPGGPFIVVDCGVLGESLIESELFGHEKGSFTGAIQRKKGLFEAAHGGTLFIDEVGDLPLPLQTKLLRALETGTIRRIGGTDYINVNVRVVAATNRDIQTMVDGGAFREDLYYRLSAFPIRIPALRERKDDVAALAEHFLAQLCDGDRYLPLTAETIQALMAYEYPGNVRELRNIVERAAIMAGDGPIRPEHIQLEVREKPAMAAAGETSESDLSQPKERLNRQRLLNRRGHQLSEGEILEALERTGGHRQQAAELLGVSERTLYRQLSRLREGQAALGSSLAQGSLPGPG
jgi:PAS domain S-box-containing protein